MMDSRAARTVIEQQQHSSLEGGDREVDGARIKVAGQRAGAQRIDPGQLPVLVADLVELLRTASHARWCAKCREEYHVSNAARL